MPRKEEFRAEKILPFFYHSELAAYQEDTTCLDRKLLDDFRAFFAPTGVGSRLFHLSGWLFIGTKWLFFVLGATKKNEFFTISYFFLTFVEERWSFKKSAHLCNVH